MDQLLNLITRAFAWIKNLVHRVIRGVLSFTNHILSTLRSLGLSKNKHTIFLMDGLKPQIKQMIQTAPVKNVGVYENAMECNVQVMEGVYDRETDEIIHAEVLGADMLDAQTKQILGNEPLVVIN